MNLMWLYQSKRLLPQQYIRHCDVYGIYIWPNEQVSPALQVDVADVILCMLNNLSITKSR